MKSYFWHANIVSKLDIVYVWSIVLGRKVACRVNTDCLTGTARPHTHSNAHLYSCKPKPIVVPHVWGQQLWCEFSIMLTAIISFLRSQWYTHDNAIPCNVNYSQPRALFPRPCPSLLLAGLPASACTGVSRWRTRRHRPALGGTPPASPRCPSPYCC